MEDGLYLLLKQFEGLWEAAINLLAIFKRRSQCTGISFNHLPETGGMVSYGTIVPFFFLYFYFFTSR